MDGRPASLPRNEAMSLKPRVRCLAIRRGRRGGGTAVQRRLRLERATPLHVDDRRHGERLTSNRQGRLWTYLVWVLIARNRKWTSIVDAQNQLNIIGFYRSHEVTWFGQIRKFGDSFLSLVAEDMQSAIPVAHVHDAVGLDVDIA